MLSDSPITTTLPTTDVKRSREFYETKLGLKVLEESEWSLLVEAGDSTKIFLYTRPPGKADHTLAYFAVEDIYKEVEDLTKKGVVFEQYDMPGGIKTDERGVAEMGGELSAWFKDPDGNILSLVQASKE